MLELVNLSGFDARQVTDLSGGEQQRVALARALAPSPRLLMFDEPLGALDRSLKEDLLNEIRSILHQTKIPAIYVTHDQEEALTMADRIAVMDKGKVLQYGTPEEIYETPTSRFVADFIGETSFLTGKVESVANGYAIVRLDERTAIKCGVNEPTPMLQEQVTVAVRPEKINLFATEGAVKFDDGSVRDAAEYKASLLTDPDINLVQGMIKFANYIGTDTRYIVTFGDGHEVIARVQNFGLRSDTFFDVGQPIYVFFDADTTRVLTH